MRLLSHWNYVRMFGLLSGLHSTLSYAEVTETSEPLQLQASYWKDAAFLKSFNGTYRVQSQVEPYVETAERDLFVSIQPLMAEGKREEALKVLTQSKLKTAAVEFNRGNLYFELGEDEEALKRYQLAIELYPSFLRAHRNLGLVYARLEKLSEAQRHLREALQLGDNHGATFGWLGHCYAQSEKISSALQAYRMARLREPDTANWIAGEAFCLQSLGKIREAQALLEEVVERYPQEVSYSLMLVDVLLQLDNEQKALATLEWLYRKEKLEGSSLLTLANLYLRVDRAALAKELIESELEGLVEHQKTGLYRWLSNAHGIVDWEGVNQILTHLADQNKEIVKDKGYKQVLAQHLAQKEPARAQELYQELVEESPLDAALLVDFAKFLDGQDQRELALIQLERALRVESEHAQALLLMGQIYVKKEQYTKSLLYLNQVKEEYASESFERYLVAVEKRAELE